jgi:hypothetical protein
LYILIGKAFPVPAVELAVVEMGMEMGTGMGMGTVMETGMVMEKLYLEYL